MSTSSFRAAEFTIEPWGDLFFPGYTAGEKWKGWEKPYFTSETALQIVKTVTQVEMFNFYKAWHDVASDTFIFVKEEGDEPQGYGAVHVEGLGSLYPIGAGHWRWEEGIWFEG